MLKELARIDRELLIFLNSLHNPALDTVMQLFSERWFWLPMYVVLVGWLIWYFRRKAYLLLPLLGLGVLLGVTTATSGVESTVSAFMWSLFISMLVLPLGASVGLPWSEGALTSYTMMTEQVDAIRDASPDALGGATFYARFAFLPIACVAGIAMVGLRFGSGVNAGIIPRESMRLDPVLEREAANVKPGSLHGGRAGNALRNMNGSNTPERKPSAPAPALATSAGEAPRRLI